MQTITIKTILKHQNPCQIICIRSKTSSAQYVASRVRDPTFEKLMDKYKNLLKVIAIQDLILANPTNNPSVSLDFLSRLSQKLHLNRGAASFLRKYPHIFHIFYNPNKSQPFCRLTDAAIDISCQEAEAINALPVVDRLVRLLSMSTTKSLPLRAVFKVWKELGLPNDFEDSIISQNSHIFKFSAAHELNTHILNLTDEMHDKSFVSSVENWRVMECCKEDCTVDRTEIQYAFKHCYPPGMRLSKDFKTRVKEWQRFPYVGPYEEMEEKERSKTRIMGLKKRAVAIVHEFLSLTVERMVEVEKISHFRKSFAINLNIRDLVLDHPGIFYLSTKGKRDTVFLREAYERGCLIDPNPVYNVRRKLLDLVVLGRHSMLTNESKSVEICETEKACLQDENKG
ncbi:hypothetical protein CRYUN_Cryun15aG0071500 [Craigia yunnanensis]